MAFAFDSATSVKKISEGLFTSEVFDGWDIMGNANGGYLLSIAGRAMREHSGRRDPFTITTHYLAPVPAGKVDVSVDTVKSGKLVTTMTASMRRDGKELVRLLGAFGEMGDIGTRYVTATPPDIAPFEQCVRRTSDDGTHPIGLLQNVTAHIHPDDSAFIDGSVSGSAVMRGWFEFKDRRPLDSLALLLATDAMAPPVFNLAIPQGWVPTLELTVHVRAVPVGTRLACIFRTRVVQGGLLEEDGELWDESGTLVALSRQMAVAARG